MHKLLKCSNTRTNTEALTCSSSSVGDGSFLHCVSQGCCSTCVGS